MRRPGFFYGFTAVFRALRFVASTPEAWPAVAVPAVLFVLLTAIGVWLSFLWVVPTTVEALGLENAIAWYELLGQWAVRLISSLLAIVAGTWLSFVLTPPLSSPALERLVALREAELGAPARTSGSFINEIMCGLKAQALALAFSTPVLLTLWLVDIVAPPAVVITLPLRYLVLAGAMAWNMLDYPLTLRNVGPSDRLSLLGTNLRAVMGYGLSFALMAAIPGIGLLVLPIAVLAATDLLWKLLEQDPTVLPALHRANVDTIASEHTGSTDNALS